MKVKSLCLKKKFQKVHVKQLLLWAELQAALFECIINAELPGHVGAVLQFQLYQMCVLCGRFSRV